MSSREEEMLRLNDAENALLLAHITYSVELKASVGVPEITPVLLSRIDPGWQFRVRLP